MLPGLLSNRAQNGNHYRNNKLSKNGLILVN
jgi:hypothetical protein